MDDATPSQRPESAAEARPPPDSSLAPGPVLRRVGLPLVLYHGLVLVGAYLVVVGFLRGPTWYEIVGWTLVITGAVVISAVLVWAARIIRSASARRATSGARPKWICVRCGTRSEAGTPTCSECGGARVRLS